MVQEVAWFRSVAGDEVQVLIDLDRAALSVVAERLQRVMGNYPATESSNGCAVGNPLDRE